jgi:beta-galactosidase GanA
MTQRAAGYREQAADFRQQYRERQLARAAEQQQPGQPPVAQKIEERASFFDRPPPSVANRHSDLSLLNDMHKSHGNPERMRELQTELERRLSRECELGLER